MQTAVILDNRCFHHEAGRLHIESPKRLHAINDVLMGGGIGRELGRLEARHATIEEISLIHDENYIRRVLATRDRDFTQLDSDTGANRFTWEASQLAAGASIVCAENVLDGKYRNAFAFVRPPGHHAEKDRAKGFCFFNNSAIAAEWLIKMRGLERVAVIDFDVHHCNGTQQAFYDRDDLLVISAHRYPFYPGTGGENEAGQGRGLGFTCNFPMECGAGDDEHMRVFEKIAEKVVRYAPQFIIVSAGYDSHRDDPIGGMKVTTPCFRRMMRDIVSMAGECCGGRLIATLEGGYDLKALRDSVEVQLEEMFAG